MMDASTEIPLCDREPIHIPGSIQPHGMMIVATRHGMLVIQAAGDIEAALGVQDWQGAPLAGLIGPDLCARVIDHVQHEHDDAAPPQVVFIGNLVTATGARLDVSAHVAGLVGEPARDLVVLELEPSYELDDGAGGTMLLSLFEEAGGAFQRATSLEALCRSAAAAVRRLTGFDRVLVYTFEEDESGRVLAEDQRVGMHSFLHHHFPASDIPAQARALYARNLVRVIPDIHYTPAALRPPAPGAPLDMSDCSLRSVAPVHLQYMFNMGMRASASFSIIKSGRLWGLIACHHEAAKLIPYGIRVACRAVAASLSREVQGKEEADGYRQRLRLRSFEDDLIRLLSREHSLSDALSRHVNEIQTSMNADGVAVLRGAELVTGGVAPALDLVRPLAAWVLEGAADPIRATDQLATVYPPAAAFRSTVSGLLAVVLAAEDPWVVLWFRAERIETVNWAGNPHKTNDHGTLDQLSPRASFEDWTETVRGRSRRWTTPELEAAGRLRQALLDVRRARQLADLNTRLTDMLKLKDDLLAQKEYLIGEVNHRVQNSMQLVSSFLSLQARGATDPDLRLALEEAGRRMSAVSLVHRRLYRGDQLDMLDASRYIEELCHDTLAALDSEWRDQIELDLAPVTISTDRAVTIGLVLTELMINANKYAYGGLPGPLAITLAEDRGQLSLSVADCGCGVQGDGKGFGSRMMQALVSQLGGTLVYTDNRPGAVATLTAPTGTATTRPCPQPLERETDTSSRP